MKTADFRFFLRVTALVTLIFGMGSVRANTSATLRADVRTTAGAV